MKEYSKPLQWLVAFPLRGWQRRKLWMWGCVSSHINKRNITTIIRRYCNHELIMNNFYFQTTELSWLLWASKEFSSGFFPIIAVFITTNDCSRCIRMSRTFPENFLQPTNTFLFYMWNESLIIINYSIHSRTCKRLKKAADTKFHIKYFSLVPKLYGNKKDYY